MDNQDISNKKSQYDFLNNDKRDDSLFRQKKNYLLKIASILLIGIAICASAFSSCKRHEESDNVDRYLLDSIDKESIKSDKPEGVTGNSENDLNLKDIHLYKDSKSLQEGKNLWDVNCAVCHKADGGGGIGPNHTDKYWINGGGFDNIYHTISEGGRPGKGMVPWKTNFEPVEIAKLASYVISLNGTSPSEPKASEGDIIWTKDME